MRFACPNSRERQLLSWLIHGENGTARVSRRREILENFSPCSCLARAIRLFARSLAVSFVSATARRVSCGFSLVDGGNSFVLATLPNVICVNGCLGPGSRRKRDTESITFPREGKTGGGEKVATTFKSHCEIKERCARQSNQTNQSCARPESTLTTRATVFILFCSFLWQAIDREAEGILAHISLSRFSFVQSHRCTLKKKKYITDTCMRTCSFAAE